LESAGGKEKALAVGQAGNCCQTDERYLSLICFNLDFGSASWLPPAES
jgi:hypothetical protein